MRLMLFGDENIAYALSGSDGLDLKEAIKDGERLVIDVPEAHSHQLLPLTNLLVSSIFGEIVEQASVTKDGRLTVPCTILLDEFGSSCGRLPEFEHRVATLRSRGVTVIAAVQAISQIENIYGKAADSILECFSTKVFLGGGLALADAKRASEMSGQCTVINRSVTTTHEGDSTVDAKKVVTRTPVGRPLLLPEEILRPPVNALLGPPATVFIPSHPPLLAYFPPAYETCRWPNNVTDHVNREPRTRER
jgi:type IV secretion system protein VirD4